jgi:outer membrane receptor protein involved in Fe transport
MSGGYESFNVARFQINGNQATIYSDKNIYQLPDYTRTDISSTYKIESKSNNWKSEISIGIYNLFNEKYFSNYFYQTNTTINRMQWGGFTPYLKIRFEL